MAEQQKALFEHTIQSKDEQYVENETQLRQAGEGMSPFLREQGQSAPDPFARFMAKTIADWIDGKGDDYEPALIFLDRIEQKANRSPLGMPRPDVTSRDLTVVYENRLTAFLALRLVQQPGLPSWKIETILLYLGHHRDIATLPALFRFAVETTHPSIKKIAVYAIKTFNQDEVSRVWIEESQFWKIQGREITRP